jgi:hypothetical protein
MSHIAKRGSGKAEWGWEDQAEKDSDVAILW